MKYTLAFDVYGTLINTSGVFDSLKPLIGDLAQPFMDAWRNKQLEYSFRRGLMNQYADFTVCTKDSFEYCCQLFKTNLTKEQKEVLLNAYTVLPAFPDVTNGLKTLKDAGHKLFAFSNGSKSTVLKLLTTAKIIDLFDGVVSVENVETFKPNPIVYEHFNKTTNSTKSNSLLISSNPFDVIGAISYGMHSAWLQRTQDSIFDPWGIEPPLIIHELTHLLPNLD
jgi:2-haloacid dehalogenase